MRNMDVKTNLQQIQSSIEQACKKVKPKTDEIPLIAVTKYVTIERTEETREGGIMKPGEHRQEGFLEKYNYIQNEEATSHFIGTLQTPKVTDVINKVDAIHSLDRMSLAKEINKRTSEPMDCFVQVNVSGEETKHGLFPDKVLPLIEELANLKNIHECGFMNLA